MRLLSELPKADLRAAGDATETLIEFRAYLPPAGPLVVLAGKFRDDIRDVLGVPLPERAERGPEVRPLDELTSEEFGKLSKAVGALAGRFTPWMDDLSSQSDEYRAAAARHAGRTGYGREVHPEPLTGRQERQGDQIDRRTRGERFSTPGPPRAWQSTATRSVSAVAPSARCTTDPQRPGDVPATKAGAGRGGYQAVSRVISRSPGVAARDISGLGLLHRAPGRRSKMISVPVSRPRRSRYPSSWASPSVSGFPRP